ncbi:hypothetical protein [Mycobacterium sp.]|nr:hypothetical protein [Mycobacterium sp.]HTQ20506.1 hypothetical protein [Mycobacterium sp.]
MLGALDVVVEVEVRHLGLQACLDHRSRRADVGTGAQHDERGAFDHLA